MKIGTRFFQLMMGGRVCFLSFWMVEMLIWLIDRSVVIMRLEIEEVPPVARKFGVGCADC